MVRLVAEDELTAETIAGRKVDIVREGAADVTMDAPYGGTSQDLGIAKATYGRDPDGNVVELQEVLDKSSPVALNL